MYAQTRGMAIPRWCIATGPGAGATQNHAGMLRMRREWAPARLAARLRLPGERSGNACEERASRFLLPGPDTASSFSTGQIIEVNGRKLMT